MIGPTIERYEVRRKIGEGGMATVYLGRHAALGRDVAIKVLHPHLSASPRNRRRFAREARAIEQLRHPNIVEILDYSGEGPESWIVTEYVDGETLADLVERCGQLPGELATLLGMSLARALAYAHERGILHRDLKPENVMLRRDGTVKLMDFGIARFLDEAQVTMTGALVGSPAFMSPEQAREETLDGRSDLFSLGTLLFLLVAGRRPFQGSNPGIVLKQILEDRRPAFAELAPDASAALADVVERLLAPSRDERFPDAHAAERALAACLDEIGLDPSEPRWSVGRFLTEPDAWREELRAWLVPTLLHRGRALLASGDALGGLRLVNRVLSIDEGNPEALALVEALHGPPERDPRGPRWMPWAAAVVVGGAFAILGAATWWAPPPRERSAPPLPPPPAAVAAAPTRPPPAASVGVVEPVTLPEPPPPPGPGPRSVGASDRAPPAPPRPAARPDPVAPATLAAAPVAAAEAALACVAFRTPEAPADVYLDGVRLRSTREPGCARVPAGEHTFVLSGPMVRERTVRLALAPGETRDPYVVRLERVPARVRFPDALAPGCVVVVDDRVRGTLVDLGRGVELERPDAPHEVVVRCGGDALTQRYERIDYPEVLFDPRGAP